MTKRRAAKQGGQATRQERAEGPVVVGARVRALYEALGYTQQDVAWLARLPGPKISRIVTQSQGISVGGLMRLAKTLGTSMDYLCGITDDPRPRLK